MKHTRVVSTKCTPGFACRAFSDTTLVCFIVNEHTTKCSRFMNTRMLKLNICVLQLNTSVLYLSTCVLYLKTCVLYLNTCVLHVLYLNTCSLFEHMHSISEHVFYIWTHVFYIWTHICSIFEHMCSIFEHMCPKTEHTRAKLERGYAASEHMCSVWIMRRGPLFVTASFSCSKADDGNFRQPFNGYDVWTYPCGPKWWANLSLH